MLQNLDNFVTRGKINGNTILGPTRYNGKEIAKTLTSVAGAAYLFLNRRSIESSFGINHSVEVLANSIEATITPLASIYFRVHGIAVARKTALFWKNHVELWTEIEILGILKDQQQKKMFDSLPRQYLLNFLAFAIPLVIYSFAVLVIVVYSFFTYLYICVWEMEQFSLIICIVTATPIFLYGISLFHFGTASAKLINNAKKLGLSLEDVPLQHVALELRQKILLLSIRFSNNPPSISPGNFFVLDRPLLTVVLGAVTTYLIVLVQFRGPDAETKQFGNYSLT
ncbi:unnamed protein product [Allacma fusca]|uniref:Gustatory receptor n=1 Tax=Allacma fusca TaxID=39272 RepID=A0A8J2K8U5_9HEXA|nr:unnamed protein product [Allacma fusca]